MLNEWLLNELTLGELWRMGFQSVLICGVKKSCPDRFLSAVILIGGTLATMVLRSLIHSTLYNLLSNTNYSAAFVAC